MKRKGKRKGNSRCQPPALLLKLVIKWRHACWVSDVHSKTDRQSDYLTFTSSSHLLGKTEITKTAKIIKRWYYSTAHWQLGDVMVSDITFLWFLLFSMCHSLHVAVNKCINWCFVHLSLIIVDWISDLLVLLKQHSSSLHWECYQPPMTWYEQTSNSQSTSLTAKQFCAVQNVKWLSCWIWGVWGLRWTTES